MGSGKGMNDNRSGVIIKPHGRRSTGGEISRRDFLKDVVKVVGGAAAVGLVGLVDACTSKEQVVGQPGHNEVWIVGRKFIPEKLTVTLASSDTTVTWTNKDAEEHTVTSDNGMFDKRLAKGESFSYPFIEHGIYRYHCVRRPKMIGQVFIEQLESEDCVVCHDEVPN